MTPRSGLRLGLALALAIAGASARAEAPDPAALCERAIVNGARRGGVPVEVLHAVALTETGQRRDGAVPGLALGDQPRGQGPLVQELRGGARPSRRRAWPRGARASTSAACRSTTAGTATPFRRSRTCSTRSGPRPTRRSSCARSTRSAGLVGGGRRLPLADPGARAEVYRRASTGSSRTSTPGALTEAEALVAAAVPGSRTSARAARREAQRRAIAERIRAAGPPPPANGGRHRRRGLRAGGGRADRAGRAALDARPAAPRRAARQPVLSADDGLQRPQPLPADGAARDGADGGHRDDGPADAGLDPRPRARGVVRDRDPDLHDHALHPAAARLLDLPDDPARAA